jgi:hypothetical protein
MVSDFKRVNLAILAENQNYSEILRVSVAPRTRLILPFLKRSATIRATLLPIV